MRWKGLIVFFFPEATHFKNQYSLWIHCQINGTWKYRNMLLMVAYITVTGDLLYCFVSLMVTGCSSGFFILLPPEGKMINPTERRNTLPLKVPAELRSRQELRPRSSASYRSKLLFLWVRNSWSAATNDFSTYRPHALLLGSWVWSHTCHFFNFKPWR